MRQILTSGNNIIDQRKLSDTTRVNVVTTTPVTEQPITKPKPQLITQEINQQGTRLVSRKVETSLSARNSIATSNLNISNNHSSRNTPSIVNQIKISGNARIGNSTRSITLNPNISVTSRQTKTSQRISRPCKGCSRANRTPTIRG